MWAFGRYDLHLSEGDFWALTLKELDALSERRKDGQEWLDYRAALICTVMSNAWRDTKKKSKPFEPGDFMPKKTSMQQTPEQIFATVETLNTMPN